MDWTIIATGLGLSITLFIVIMYFLRPARQVELLAQVTNEEYGPDVLRPDRKSLIVETLAKPLGGIRKLGGGTPNPDIVRRLMLAGYRKPFHVDIFLGAKLVMPATAGLLVGLFVKDNVIVMFILALMLSFFFPDFWLTWATNKRRERIQFSLPDTLDLLSICMEAGLGLDQAIIRVGQELKLSHPEISDELLQINLEQRAGNPRIGAWRNMADRVGLETIRSFVNILVQTERFGTPVSKTLSVFSETLRTQRRQRAEELAAKTTIKLVFPLVLFIFPSIFIVTAAPAVITLVNSFGTIFK